MVDFHNLQSKLELLTLIQQHRSRSGSQETQYGINFPRQRQIFKNLCNDDLIINIFKSVEVIFDTSCPTEDMVSSRAEPHKIHQTRFRSTPSGGKCQLVLFD